MSDLALNHRIVSNPQQHVACSSECRCKFASVCSENPVHCCTCHATWTNVPVSRVEYGNSFLLDILCVW